MPAAAGIRQAWSVLSVTVSHEPDPSPSKTSFWIGNALLAMALLMLFNMNPLAERFGLLAFVIWAGLAAGGIYLVMKDKHEEPPL